MNRTCLNCTKNWCWLCNNELNDSNKIYNKHFDKSNILNCPQQQYSINSNLQSIRFYAIYYKFIAFIYLLILFIIYIILKLFYIINIICFPITFIIYLCFYKKNEIYLNSEYFNIPINILIFGFTILLFIILSILWFIITIPFAIITIIYQFIISIINHNNYNYDNIFGILFFPMILLAALGAQMSTGGHPEKMTADGYPRSKLRVYEISS